MGAGGTGPDRHSLGLKPSPRARAAPSGASRRKIAFRHRVFFGAAWEKKTGDTRARLLLGATPHQPKGLIKGTHLVGDPAPRALPSPGAACAGGAPNRPRPRARAVRPARGNPWGRSGRLHAPEAPRTGPVSALRRYSSWSPPGRWLNGHNGHFSCQPGRDHVCQLPGPYGSGFNGPRAVLKSLPTLGTHFQNLC